MDLQSLHIETNFTTLDWVIVTTYVLAIVGVGVYIRRYVKNVAQFIVAGRSLKTPLAIATMIGTELGLVTVMYAAQKGFTGGFAAFHIALVAAAVTLAVGLSGFIVVPLRRLGVMTIPEFYEHRFGRGVRILGGAILAFAGILNMGFFLKTGALFLTTVTGMTSHIQLNITMTILLAFVLLYTTLGGMVSVVVLDYIQFVVLSIALVATTFLAINHLGWTNIIDTVKTLKGTAGFDPFDTAGFGPAYVIWMVVLGLVGCAIWQTSVIRACAAQSTRVVRKLYIFSSVGFLIGFLIPYFFGICAFVFFAQSQTLRPVFLPLNQLPDPEISLIAMPLFLSKLLPAGLIGLVTAGMLAAFMSTHDSYLLCWSAVLTQDVVAPWFRQKPLSSQARVLCTRAFIIGIGIFILIWGLWFPLGQDLWDYMAISGAVYFTGAGALLIFGLYWKRASKAGAYLALLSGFGALLGLQPVQAALRFPKPIDSEYVGLATFALALALMIVGSLLFPDNRRAAQELIVTPDRATPKE